MFSLFWGAASTSHHLPYKLPPWSHSAENTGRWQYFRSWSDRGRACAILILGLIWIWTTSKFGIEASMWDCYRNWAECFHQGAQIQAQHPCPGSPEDMFHFQGPHYRAFLGTSSTELSVTSAAFTNHNISESSVSFICVFRIRTSAMAFEILSRRTISFILPGFHSKALIFWLRLLTF